MAECSKNGNDPNITMDGRDIGTVVSPMLIINLLTASVEEKGMEKALEIMEKIKILVMKRF